MVYFQYTMVCFGPGKAALSASSPYKAIVISALPPTPVKLSLVRIIRQGYLHGYPYGYRCGYPCRIIRATDSSPRRVALITGHRMFNH